MVSSYREQFEKIMKEFGLKNKMTAPKITKVVINTGIGRLLTASKNTEETIKKISNDLSLTSGQKPAIRSAKKSIASFKIRDGMPVGLKVTLRGKKMEDFIYKFINVVLPQVRDFWGISLKSVDEKGNLNYGLKDQSVFPEISKEHSPLSFGMEITFVVDAKNKEQAIKMYKLLGFPLQEKQEK